MGVFQMHKTTVLLALTFVLCCRMSSGQNITCKTNGYVCSTDCKTVYQCLGSTPNFNLVTLERCDKTKHYYCSYSLGKCSSTFASTCPPADYQFKCTSIGIFPDPYDCAVFHMCHTGTNAIADSEERCENGWLYSVEHHSCRIEANACLEDPVPRCTSGSQIGALKNPAYYYQCTATSDGVFYPTIYECPHGGVFKDAQGRCVESSL